MALVFRTGHLGRTISGGKDLLGDRWMIGECGYIHKPAIELGQHRALMVLSQEHVRELLPALQYFVEHGKLPKDGE